MTRRIINLGDDRWQFGQVPRQPFTAAELYDLPTVTEWLPATVPGNVRTDLLALDLISDPFFGEGYQESLWVEAVDWWYRRAIKVEHLAPAERAFVVFEGIDYLSAIFVDGRESTRHEGMFSRQVVEITEVLQSDDGIAEIAIRLWGSGALPRRQLTWLQRSWQKIAGALYGSWVGVYPDRSATLKCQMSFGWDFAPPIRTMGLWDEVYLVITGPVFIAEANITSRPILPQLTPTPSLTFPADFSINLTLDSDRPRPVEATVLVTPANFAGPAVESFRFRLDLPAGCSVHRLQFRLPRAALWYPWDRGQAHLYHLTISLSELEGDTLDEVVVRTGVRAVELQQWQFSINGQPEFIRGLNWVPADCFPGRLRPADYAHLLTTARESGANLIRVWGGGLREKQAFYNLCDELGLLVWQEFPFACMFLGAYPRHPAYLARVEAECGAIVRQLGHHPALTVWCGGNEFSRWRNRPLLDTLAAVVKRFDGSRPFIPVSPSSDHGGDTHNWHVWHGDAPIRAYQAETARFLSEFGLQALPHPDTLAAVLPDPTHPQCWQTHHGHPQKLARYASLFDSQDTLQVAGGRWQVASARWHVSCPNRQPETLTAQITASQRAQAVALQTAIEHMRRRKGETGGVCLWQFNEPWPAISWAIVDYFGRSKLAYERLSRWYNPVLVSLKFPVGRRWQAGETFTAEIWAINDSLQRFGDCQFQIALAETVIHTQTLDLPPDSARLVGRLAHRLAVAPRQVTLTLRHGTEVLSQNSYDLGWFDTSRGSLYQRFRRWVAGWVLR